MSDNSMREPCAHYKGIRDTLKILQDDMKKISEWMIADELKQTFHEEGLVALTDELSVLVTELKETKQDFNKELFELRLALSKEYVVKSEGKAFEMEVVETLEKLNNKIDASNKTLQDKIEDNDKKIREDMKASFWKGLTAAIGIGGLLATLIFNLIG